jgi:hypothetical protein
MFKLNCHNSKLQSPCLGKIEYESVQPPGYSDIIPLCAVVGEITGVIATGAVAEQTTVRCRQQRAGQYDNCF